MNGFDILIWAIFGLVLLVILAKYYHPIPEDEEHVTTMFGAYFRTMRSRPWPQFMVPFEKIATTRQDRAPIEAPKTADGKPMWEIAREGMHERYLKTEKGVRSKRSYDRVIIVRNTITADGITIPEILIGVNNRMMNKTENETVNERLIAEGKLRPEDRHTAAYKSTFALGSPVPEAVLDRTNGSLRSVIGKHKFEEDIINQPELIKKETEKEINEAMELWGDTLNYIVLPEVFPPEDVQLSLRAPFEARKAGEAAVVTAEKAAKAAESRATEQIALARGDKESTILRAEGLKQGEILAGEGVRRKLELEAQGKGIAIKTLAETYGFKEGGELEANREARKEATNYMLGEEAFKSASTIASNGGLLAVTGSNPMGELVAMGRALAKAVSEGGIPTTSVVPMSVPPPSPSVPQAPPETQPPTTP